MISKYYSTSQYQFCVNRCYCYALLQVDHIVTHILVLNVSFWYKVIFRGSIVSWIWRTAAAGSNYFAIGVKRHIRFFFW